MKNKIFTLTRIVALLTIIWLLTELYDWWQERNVSLVGEVSYGAFKFPDGYYKNIEEAKKIIEELKNDEKSSTLKKELDVEYLLGDLNKERLEEIKTRIFEDLSSYVYRNFSDSSLSNFWGLYGYWDMKISNNGSSELLGVSMKLPKTKFIAINREGKPPEFLHSNEIIKIGTLQPKEMIKVYAWTDSEPHEYSGERIKLTHNQGVGDITVRTEVGSFWFWMERNYIFLLIFIILVSFWTMVYFYFHMLSNKSVFSLTIDGSSGKGLNISTKDNSSNKEEEDDRTN